MQRILFAFLAVLAVGSFGTLAFSDPPPERGEKKDDNGEARPRGDGERGRPDARRPDRAGRDGERRERPDDRRGPPDRRPGPPLVAALDLDKDGEISADEIAKASESLKKLDKNGDGKLTPDEIRPPGPPPGRGPRPGAEGPPRRERGGAGDNRPERRPPPRGERPEGERPE
jgi:hypothetical protein